MFRQTNKIHILYFCIDLVIIFFSLFIVYLIKFNPEIIRFDFSNLVFPNLNQYIFIYVLWAILIVSSFQKHRLYYTDRSLTIPKEIYLVSISLIYTSIIIASIIFFTQLNSFSRLLFLFNFAALFFLLSFWRIVKRITLRRLIKNGFHNLNVLLIGTNELAKLLIHEIRGRPFLGLKVVGTIADSEKNDCADIPILGNLNNFEEVCKKHFIDEVFVVESSQKNLVSEIIKIAKKMHVGLRIIPSNFEEARCYMGVNYLGFIPLLTYKERQIHPGELAIKRGFDFLVSTFLLVLLFPLFLIIGILIKLYSQGPVFYVQKRLGRKGQVFNFYKFRSMVNDADKLKTKLLEKNEVKDGIIFKIRKDPRITKLGYFLRKYSLDELPQLINVLKGDMSLVGPRPPTPDEVEKYNHVHIQRLFIRPGITGLSQVKGRSDLTFRSWVRWDLWYINNWSFGLDLKILWWTMPAVLKGEGAY